MGDLDGRRWWDIAFGATSLVVGVIVWLSEADDAGGASRIGAWAVLLILCACYYTFGRRQLGRETAGLLFQTILVVGVAIGAAFSPNMLTMQVVMIPLLWVLTRNTRTAVILNVVSAIALGIGFAVGIGVQGSEGVLAQAAFIQGISLVFSIALGLWISRIHEYAFERARLLQQLQDAQAETERASRDAGAASERERMARDIHDTIAQSLTSVVMLAQRARAESPMVADDTIDLIETTAREALGEARALVATNAGFPASDTSLHDSLQRLASRFERETGVVVRLDATTAQLPRALEVVLLRCAQEGLANVRKHAGARSVELGLRVARSGGDAVQSGDGDRAVSDGAMPADAPEISLTVCDDGVGFPADGTVRERGFGIDGMQSRVELLGGRVTTANREGGGAMLRVSVPVPTPATPPAATPTPDPASAANASAPADPRLSPAVADLLRAARTPAASSHPSNPDPEHPSR